MSSLQRFALRVSALTIFLLNLASCANEAPIEQGRIAAPDASSYVTWNGTALDTAKSFHSSGGAIAVSPDAAHPGRYTVSIANMSGLGNALVTALGPNNVRCKIWNVTTAGTTAVITVGCHTPAQVETNTAFMLSYATFSGGTTLSPEGAYVYMNQETTGTGALLATKMWGDTVTVSRPTGLTGQYMLTFAGQPLTQGNIQVSAFGAYESYCKISATTATTVSVNCFEQTGTPKNSRFYLRFTRAEPVCETGIHDTQFGSGGYVKFTGSSTILSQYHFNQRSPYDCNECEPINLTNYVALKVAGVNTVMYPEIGFRLGFAADAVVITTAVGADATYCKSTGIAYDNTFARSEAGVKCYSSTGATVVASDYYQILLTTSEQGC